MNQSEVETNNSLLSFTQHSHGKLLTKVPGETLKTGRCLGNNSNCYSSNNVNIPVYSDEKSLTKGPDRRSKTEKSLGHNSNRNSSNSVKSTEYLHGKPFMTGPRENLKNVRSLGNRNNCNSSNNVSNNSVHSLKNVTPPSLKTVRHSSSYTCNNSNNVNSNTIHLLEKSLQEGKSLKSSVKPCEDNCNSCNNRSCGSNSVEAEKTSLITAVAKGDITMATALLQQGCNVNIVPQLQTKQYGDGALHLASVQGNVAMATLLIKCGADVNVTSFGGRTPLMKACFHGNLEVAKFLVSKGANVNQTDYQGMSGFLYSCARGHVDIANYLLSISVDVNQRNWKGETGLLLAAQENHYDVIKLLLSNKCDVNMPTQCAVQTSSDIPSGSTALHIAARDGHVTMTRDLIRYGAEINFQNCTRRTPLHYSCDEGNCKVTELLLSCDCELNLQNIAGETALYEAVQSRRLDTVRLLLNCDSDPNIETSSGTSPLKKAISMNCSDIVKYLVMVNCDVKCCEKMLKVDNKKEAFKMKFTKESMEIMRILLIAGVGRNTILRLAKEKYFRSQGTAYHKDTEYIDPVAEEQRTLSNEYFTLKHICRIRIRRIMGARIRSKMEQMDLPISLKEYIMLPEIV